MLNRIILPTLMLLAALATSCDRSTGVDQGTEPADPTANDVYVTCPTMPKDHQWMSAQKCIEALTVKVGGSGALEPTNGAPDNTSGETENFAKLTKEANVCLNGENPLGAKEFANQVNAAATPATAQDKTGAGQRRNEYFKALSMLSACEHTLERFRKYPSPSGVTTDNEVSDEKIQAKLDELNLAHLKALANIVFFDKPFPSTTFFCVSSPDCDNGDRVSLVDQFSGFVSEGKFQPDQIYNGLTPEMVAQKKLKGIGELIETWKKLPKNGEKHGERDLNDKERLGERLCEDHEASLTDDQKSLLDCNGSAAQAAADKH